MEKFEPLVSIITATYNHDKYIGKCIESVLSQSYPNWEQIIIDDGSTDKTEEIIARYDDKRIKYIKQKNVGIYNLKETYNKALELSKGDLIAILEGDDFWPPNKLKTQIKAFEDEKVGFSWGKAEMTDDYGKCIEIRPNYFEKYEKLSKIEVTRNLLMGGFIPACTVMCRKSALLAIGGFKQPPSVPYVDYPTWLELSLNEKFLALDSILGCWRRHQNQMSTSKLLEMIESSKFSIDFFKKLDKKLKNSINLTVNELEQNYRHRVAAASFYLGRKNLINANWEDGKKDFKRAIINGPILLKFKSLLGLICAYFKMDLEGIATKLNRGAYNDYE